MDGGSNQRTNQTYTCLHGLTKLQTECSATVKILQAGESCFRLTHTEIDKESVVLADSPRNSLAMRLMTTVMER
jgi:hypothetical protein